MDSMDVEQPISLVNKEGEIIGDTQVNTEVSGNVHEHATGNVAGSENEQLATKLKVKL